MVIYGIFIMAVGKAAMHRSYLYPHNPTFWRSFARKSALFLRKSRSCAPFQHKLCWARELRSNTPCPGSTFSCTDCLVHTNRAGGSPRTDGGFFAEPQLECAAYGARGTCRAPRQGQEGRHQGFYPLNSHFLFGRVWRRLPTCDRFEKRVTAEDFSYRRGAQCAPLSRHIRRVGYRTATQVVYSTQARHTRVAQLFNVLYRTAPAD